MIAAEINEKAHVSTFLDIFDDVKLKKSSPYSNSDFAVIWVKINEN